MTAITRARTPNRTYSPRTGEVERRWYVVDAEGVPLGRLATRLARILTGKDKPAYARHIDVGDFAVVVNAGKAVLTGGKDKKKIYYRHSGQPGKLKSETAARLRRRRPTRLVELAVRGMLPKNRLGRRQLRKLKVYAGADHPHQAQQPEAIAITGEGSAS